MATPGDEIVEVAHVTAMACKDAELLSLLHGLLEPTRKEEGCLRYELNQDAGNPRCFTVTAKFAGRIALEKHLNSRHVKRFAERAADSDLIESREIRIYRELLPAARGEPSIHA
jgi:quinol monooxygenase YgiN